MNDKLSALQSEQAEFLSLPAGTYKVRASSKSKDTESSKGAQQIILELEVIEGDQMGRTVRNYLTEGNKSSSFIGQALVGFGIPLSSVTSVNAALFIGKVATVETIINGTYANVKKFIPKGVDEVDEPEEEETDIPFGL